MCLEEDLQLFDDAGRESQTLAFLSGNHPPFEPYVSSWRYFTPCSSVITSNVQSMGECRAVACSG
jgi:hypothetical protein